MSNQERPLCPICGNPSDLRFPGTIRGDAYFGRSSSYQIAEGRTNAFLPLFACRSCGHGFSPPGVAEDVLTAFYQSGPPDETYLATGPSRRKTARVILHRIATFRSPPGRLLDIGCGPGLFLDEARRAGWKIHGCEPSRWSCAKAGQRLGESIVLEGDAGRLADFPRESFAVVTLFDVLEHVLDPRAAVRLVSDVLAPGGLLVLTAPRFDSLVARLMGKRWHAILPAHLSYFTRPSLEHLLREAHFTLVRIRAHTRHLPLGYLASRLLHREKGAPEHWRSIPVLSVSVPVVMGDEFEVYARKGDAPIAPSSAGASTKPVGVRRCGKETSVRALARGGTGAAS